MKIAFWMLPAEPMRSTLRRHMEHLAARHNAFPFMPHVTVGVGDLTEAEALDRIARVKEQLPLTLRPMRLAASNELKQTLYYDMEDSAALQTLRHTVNQGGEQLPPPHLSLLYQHLDDATRDRLCREHHPLEGPLPFDQIWAAHIPAPFKEPDDLLDWRVIK